jgi:cytochrome c oxidase subunit 1
VNTAPLPADLPPIALERPRAGGDLWDWLTTTDHKRIGLLYIGTAFVFFLLGGLMAMVMRVELAQPGLQVVDNQMYAQLFSMHGTVMMLLFATPVAVGFGNYLVPLQIGAPDMAFPRLNALSYWLFVLGGIIVLSGFFTAGGAMSAGWTGYPPLSERPFTPGAGVDLWLVGLILTGISSIMGAVNFLATIFSTRAPGMTMLRLPVFTWGMIATAALMLFAFPPLTAALFALLIDRQFGGGFFDPVRGGDPILWQHLFWFFGHPEVYIVILPFFGVLSEVIPVFSRKPIFGYKSMILAFMLIAGWSMSVWAHHMFTTGAISLPFFSIASFVIAVPTGIKIFNWTATMWRGQLRFTTAMLFAVGTIYLFVIGGITGIIVASPPLDFHFHDTYFVVAHMHNVLVSGTVTAMFAGFYFWFPKATGRFLDERLGKLHFWSWIVGFTLTFLPMYQLGASGMPRRYPDYPASAGWTELNLLSTVGALLLAVGLLPFLLAVVKAVRSRPTAPADPWGGNSLEWATTSPPPHHNFRWLPPIRSHRPVFDWRAAQDATGKPGPESESESRPHRATGSEVD